MYRDFLTAVLETASDIARQNFGKVSGWTKEGDNSQVLTETDIEIGNLIVARIKEAYPDHNIIDEEAGVIDRGSGYTWVIDPIEATSNFAAGLPDYGIMIGLLDDAVPIAGGIVAPAFDKLYTAEKGKGATCNGQPIHVTACENLSEVLVSFSADGHPEDPARTNYDYGLLTRIALVTRNTRNNNCEATDTMYVAEGRYGGRVNMVSKIWDNVAPQIICEEAGALWTSHDGKPLDFSSPLTKTTQNFSFCVAPPVLHAQLQAIINPAK